MTPAAVVILSVIGIVALILVCLVLYAALKQWQVQRQVPPRGAFVTVPTGRVHYLSCGSGPEIVMIHGLGGQLGNFDTGLIDNLARDHRVTAIDRPGMGYSERPAGTPTNVLAQADQIMGIIDALGIERPLIVGHSLGGAIAMAMAIRHGSRIRGLALLAPLTMPIDEIPEAFAGLAIRNDLLRRVIGWTFAVPTMVRRPEPMIELVFGPEAIPPSYPIRGGGLLELRPRHFIQASRDFVASGDDLPAMQRAYHELTVPVRILYGTEDRILDPDLHGTQLVTRFPQIGLELADGGHMLPVTRPDVCATFVRRASQAMK